MPGAVKCGVPSKEVRLSPKAFDLLTFLIEHRPRVVSKAEIRDRLWPGTFVSDSSLPSLISEVREAIGDRRRKPPLLRTLHGVGYAFQGQEAPVEEGTPVPKAPNGWLVGDVAEIALAAGDNVLGREGTGIILLKSSTVSRRHARIRIEGRPCGCRGSGQQERYIRQRPAGHVTHAGRRWQSSANRIAAVYLPPASAGGINRDALGAQQSSITTLISDRCTGRASPGAGPWLARSPSRCRVQSQARSWW